jgi:hypothetical protein
MNGAAGSSGSLAFADSGYFAEVIASEPKVLESLRLLLDETAQKGSAAFSHRLIYGTDWEMTLTEAGVDSYLSQFIALMKHVEQPALPEAFDSTTLTGRFFGTNAVDWIGRRKGQAARERLATFTR